MMETNTLYYGDNLDILRRYIRDETVDLVYLDPPFNSNVTYNVLFGEQNGSQAAAQVKVFEDTWQWDQAAAHAYQETVEAGGRVSEALQGLHRLLGSSNMMAYLAMMAPRLVELHRVLNRTGSIYLHCDPTASHYIKVLMDATFQPTNFRTEVVWKRASAHSDTKQGRKQHGRIHDIILFYTKSDDWTWNPVYTPYDDGYVESFYKYVEPETGRRYGLYDLVGPGGAAKGNPSYEVMGVTRYWRYSREKMNELIAEGRVVQTRPGAVPRYKRYLDEMPGVSLQDIWADIKPIGAQKAERLGYPTQKPEQLLQRIIEASSNEGDLVMDPFCGCGTAVVVAQRLGRRWIGIDITYLAINLIKRRLRDAFGDESSYQVLGEPVSLPDARSLAEQDPYQFQWWALDLVGGRPADQKKGSDKGIDGRLYFHDEAEGGKTKQVILSVKAGHTSPKDIRDLLGVLDREKAQIGVLISMVEPTQAMRAEAAGAGFYDSAVWGTRHPRLQILTVEELLGGRAIDMPAVRQQRATFKKAPKAKGKGPEQLPLED